MAERISSKSWQQAIVVLTFAVIIVITVAFLYWAQIVLIPVALSIFLAFMMSPLVRRLQQRGAGRITAVITTVTLAGVLLAGLTWFIGRQVASLLTDLPEYSENIKTKVRSVREITSWMGNSGLEGLLTEISEEFNKGSDVRPKDVTGSVNKTFVVESGRPGWLGRLPDYLGSTLEWLGALALVLVLVIFLLLNREDMRNRLLRLAGERRLSFTTKALSEASRRISRYLLMQLIINGSYGLILTLGLMLIGVQYPLLWGLLAAVLRYIPYLGPWLAAVFPIVLSLAMFETWWQSLAVIGFILVLELISNNFMEPLLYGHTIGVSEVGLLVCAAFWTFLWGPIGLVLSAPLTVCLVILGKHVPSLKFLDILLGDRPVLSPARSFYQRLLARDPEEARQLLRTRLREPNPELIPDEFIVPALRQVRRDCESGDLNESDQAYVLEAIHDCILDWQGSEFLLPSPEEGPAQETEGNKVRLLACPARDEADRLSLEMLRGLLGTKHWEMDLVGSDCLSGELLEKAVQTESAIICIGAFPAHASHAKLLCKRLREQCPDRKIVVGLWGKGKRSERAARLLVEAGADEVVTTLVELRNHLNALKSVEYQDQGAAT